MCLTILWGWQLTPEVSLCPSLSRKVETNQHANIGTSVRSVNNFFFLLDIISDMRTVYVGHPVFLLNMLFTLFWHSLLCTQPLLRFLISFGYTHEALEMYPYAEADLGPLQHQ